MSLGYAEKLSYREDLGGQLGNPEQFDSETDLAGKIAQLAELVRGSKRIVAFTGAGISTACGIPDFRGPKGVWTLQRAGQPLPKPKVTFAAAKPSLTHQALVGLLQAGKLTYVVSQNVDGLHLRSGIPRKQLAELHGNCFAERCSKCCHEYIRDFEIETCTQSMPPLLLGRSVGTPKSMLSRLVQVGFKPTGRRCTQRSCRGVLKDHILDWEDALPEDELEESERQASQADLAICLGTSLQITPACDLPLRTLKAGGKLVIVNLQATPKDRRASLVIRARADRVMQHVMRRLACRIPVFRREDLVTVSCSQKAVTPSRGNKRSATRVAIAVGGRGVGARLPLPLLGSVGVTFLEPEGVDGAELTEHPFELQRVLPPADKLRLRCDLQFSEAADEDKRSAVFEGSFELQAASGRSSEGLDAPPATKWRTFLTQVVSYEPEELEEEASLKRQKTS